MNQDSQELFISRDILMSANAHGNINNENKRNKLNIIWMFHFMMIKRSLLPSWTLMLRVCCLNLVTVMLVTESLYWSLFSLCWWFFKCIKSVTNILNLSSTHLVSKIRQQHQCNPWIFVSLEMFSAWKDEASQPSPQGPRPVSITMVWK